VTCDGSGRFPPIYLDNSITYAVTFNAPSGYTWTVNPFIPQLATTGISTNSATGLVIAPTGEAVIPAPSANVTGAALTINASYLGSACLRVSSTLAGQSTITINNSVTTGANTPTLGTNKPGTATSSPAGWLPIVCDGVQYYIPIWHGNNFTPYTATPGTVGSAINATTANFQGNGAIVVTNGTASPSSWFVPNTTGVGAGDYIGFTKTGGLSGATIVLPVTLTVAPSGGAYVGGTLSANWPGTTASNYVVQFATGQLVTGCTLTNGGTAFVCPSTSVNAGATTTIYVWLTSRFVNITAAGQTFQGNNVGLGAPYTYALSNSLSGNPNLSNGTIQLQGSFGPNSATWNVSVVSGNFILNADGSATANGVATTNWAGNGTTLANQGANYWINITRTGGTTGFNFSAAQGAWTNITNGGLSIGITPSPTSPVNVTGTYQIALDSAGANVVAQSTVTLNGGTAVQSPNWSGTPNLVLKGDGSATLNGVATSSWYSPNQSNVGSGYWINITRTSGTTGVNFSAAQGSWTNITNSGLTIGLTSYTGDVGTVQVVGSWKISNSSGGSPVLGSGTVTLTVTGLTVIHIYTSAVTNATETIPTGTTTSTIEAWGSGGGGSGGKGNTPDTFDNGSGGGGGGYVRSTLSGQVGHTWKYTIGSGGAGGVNHGAGGNGANTTVTAGTVTGWTTMTAGGGSGGIVSAGGAGGSASGGTAANTTGNAGQTSPQAGGGAGRTGTVSGDGSPYGAGGSGGFGTGSGTAGNRGAVVFFYS
jgi:hypothetical protein